jgi:hypothetical protein
MELAAPIFKKAGIAEFPSYAKAKISPGNDFIKSYMAFYMQSLSPVTADEKVVFTGFPNGVIKASPVEDLPEHIQGSL